MHLILSHSQLLASCIVSPISNYKGPTAFQFCRHGTDRRTEGLVQHHFISLIQATHQLRVRGWPTDGAQPRHTSLVAILTKAAAYSVCNFGIFEH